MGRFAVPEFEYSRYTNRQLLVVPLAVLAMALAILGGWYLVTGSPVAVGVELGGGTEMTVETTSSEDEVAAAFDPAPSSVQAVQAQENQYIVQFTSDDEDALTDQAEANLEPVDDGSVVQQISSVSPAFAQQAQRTALFGLAVAFVGMSVLAFLLFRTFVPSIAIVASAFSDLVIPLAFMNVIGIELTLGTVAALLLLIGYSVDSDILLNNHVLRRSGSFYESVHRATRTGVTMTVTSMVAMLVMAISAYALGIELLASVGIILFVGLAADLMNTYLMNFTLLRWYKFEGVAR